MSIGRYPYLRKNGENQMRALKLSIGLMALFLFASFSPVLTGTGGTGPDIHIPETTSPEFEEVMEKVRDNTAFIENKGQMGSDEIEFYSSNGNVFFTSTGVMYRFREMEPIYETDNDEGPIHHKFKEPPRTYHERGVVLKYTFIGANNVIPVGMERCSWNTNYFKGNDPEKWYTEVPNYLEVWYPNLWDNIDLVYRQNEKGMKYDLILRPGADPGDLQIRIEGQDSLSISEKGDLLIGTMYWDIVDQRLFTYYQDGSGRLIPCEFEIINEHEYSFILTEYDKSRTVVIDPYLAYSTFIGGSNHDWGEAIAIDSSGNSYITGYTSYDNIANYPTTPGAYDTLHDVGSMDAFVTKLSSDGSSLSYSTFIGGTGADRGYGIAVDSSGNCYITGYTAYDSSTNYPTTAGAYDTTHNGGDDAFVTKLSSDGSSLIYSTYLGSSSTDLGDGIDVDLNGNVYITGPTYSSDFPTTNGAYDTKLGGVVDAFVTKLNYTGSSLIYSTLIGGSGSEISYGIATDSSGNAFITGYTNSDDCPTTNGAYDTTSNGPDDVFVTKLNSTGSSLIYSTYIGGTGDEQPYGGIAIDSNGNVYVAGETLSTNYPTTTGAYDTAHNSVGNDDIFVTKLNSAGSSLLYSTFIGGSKSETPYGIETDNKGQASITGLSSSSDYPITSGAYDTSLGGEYDVVVTKLSSNGSSLVYSTFLGGSSRDIGNAIALDLRGNSFITGYTDDSTTDYPTTTGAYDTTPNGNYDVFVSKLDFTVLPTQPVDLNGKIGNGFINLTWEPPLSDGGADITRYDLYKGTTSDSLSHYQTLGNVTTFNDTAIVNGGTYYYAVTAFNYMGESERSDILKVHDDDPPNLTDITPSIATTGDEFNISCMVDDNVLVDRVVLVIDDTYNNVTTSYKDFKSNGLCTFKYTAPTRIVDEVMYSISAFDLSGNIAGIDGSFRVVDNDPPELFADNTNYPITTGEWINFSFEIRDNMEVAWANLTLEIDNETWGQLKLTKGSGNNWSEWVEFGDNNYYNFVFAEVVEGPPFDLILTFEDIFGNSGKVELQSRRLIDNDPPSVSDESNKSFSTGENHTFRLRAMDNVGIGNAMVEYWYMDGIRHNVMMERTNTIPYRMEEFWEAIIEVPISPPYTEEIISGISKIESYISYSYHVWDSSGNEVVWNSTPVRIWDTIPPELVSHEYIPETGPTTGDPFEIRVGFRDNIRVSYSRIRLEMSTQSGKVEYRQNAYMNRSEVGDDSFIFKLQNIPDSDISFLKYSIEVWGPNGEYFYHFPDLNITDNDSPTISSYFAERSTTTGGELYVWVRVRDNWKVSDVRMDLWSKGVVKEFILKDYDTISDSDEWDHPFFYELVLDIPIDSVEPIHIILKVTDQSNNTVSTPELVINVHDNIVPTLQPISNITIKKGETLQIAAVAADNIGIDQVHWEGSPITASGLTLEGIMNQAGPFIINVTVVDKAGNSNTTSLYLIV